MKDDLIKAKNIMNSSANNCVLCKGNSIYSSTKRGVKPVQEWVENGVDLKGYCVANKIVDKVAASTYVLVGIEEVYASIMSNLAQRILQTHGIKCSCNELL